MDELKDQFIQRSIAALRELSTAGRENLRVADTFRRLHTIKGTAQTFGLEKASKLAHNLETMLSGSTDRSFIEDGFKHLISLLEDENCTDTFEPVHDPAVKNSGSIFVSSIPCEVVRKLADNERTRIFSAYSEGLGLFRVDKSFPMTEFTASFKTLKEKLDGAGEVIAALPGEAIPGSLAFKFYIAAKNVADLEAVAERVDASLTDLTVTPGPLQRAIAQLGAHAVDLAYCSAKKVNFICCITGNTPSENAVKTVFDMLLHLTRNAVDHAFSEKGNIFVSLSIKDDGTRIIFEDDGAGIDPERVNKSAADKGLADTGLTEEEVIALIFSPGFSTAVEVTETSGRGVGLDAVKAMAEGSGGSIEVASTPGAGTRFEIFLPS